jgi:hypothetical protein
VTRHPGAAGTLGPGQVGFGKLNEDEGAVAMHRPVLGKAVTGLEAFR